MFSIYHRAKALVSAVAALVSVTVLSTADADHIPAGFDYFETVPNGTYIDFSNNPIPPGFFDPGSDPFTAIVPLQGVPLNPATLGTTDTIVQRLSDVVITQHGGPVTIPTEMVQLYLHSVNPITVTYNGGHNPEFWNVIITLPPNQQQQQGSMTMIYTSPHGGTYDSTLPVLPIVTFTRISDNQTRTLAPEPILHGTTVPMNGVCVNRNKPPVGHRHPGVFFCPSCDLTCAPVSSPFVWSSQGSNLIIQIVRPATLQ